MLCFGRHNSQPLLLCTWLPVRSPSVSIRQLDLQTTYAFRFVCKHIVDINLYATFPEVWELERFQIAKVTSRSLVSVPFDKPHNYDFLLVFHCNHVPVLYCFQIYHFCSVHDACDPEKMLHFRYNSWNYRPRTLPNLCLNISQLIRAACSNVCFKQLVTLQGHSRSLVLMPFDRHTLPISFLL